MSKVCARSTVIKVWAVIESVLGCNCFKALLLVPIRSVE